MTNLLARLLIALSLAVIPGAAFAQETDAPATPLEIQAEQGDAAVDNVPLKVSMDLDEDRENILLLDLSNGERVAIRLMPEWAPAHVGRIKTLARQGFYDGVIFHRVIDGFMAQTGDPTGTGQGGSQLPDLAAEFNRMPHVRGTVSMARAAMEDSANSQFFIVFYPRFALDQRYTNFGRVISNMAAVDAIERGEPPANPSRILQASIAADNKPQVLPRPEAPPAMQITADMLDNSVSN